ncbi:MAG: biopolymer transporter ExbD [Gammaproteobacteria bacterium]|nr:biopolymer transporter ExbD [Gammaproteobacteria bacterium]
MKLRNDPGDPAEINLTPLIDIVFLLLIFFMVSTTFERDSELSIELPQAAADPAERAPQSVEVTIDARGRFYVAGRQLVNTQTQTLMQALGEAIEGRETPPPVIISADANTPHQAVVQVMDAARQLGLVRLTFATRVVKDAER